MAGCGGSSRTISTTETFRPASVVASANLVAEFHRRGQALCQARLRIPLNGAQQTTPKALAAAERRDLAASARFYRQLEALTAPKSLAPYVHQYLALQHREDAVWRRIVTRVETGTSFPNAMGPDQKTITNGASPQPDEGCWLTPSLVARWR
jgi:hypothetical protein